jgi:hypothetical protein
MKTAEDADHAEGNQIITSANYKVVVKVASDKE